jgi:serine/threonine-protein kinase
MSPQEFGHYRLESLIGSGGMGDVYHAFDLKRGRAVALKLLPALFSGDREFERRFRRESQVVARLREPHIIPIHDYGEIEKRLFIDMRLVDGGSNIATLLRDNGAMRPERAVHIISQVAEALDAAHHDGLIHRDVKPSNVLVTPHDFVYVVDFGIAHAIGHTASSLTMTGTTVGTLDYMAPERFSSRTVDCRADVYSLACVLYECLTASKPFTGSDLPKLMYAHLYEPAPAPSAFDPSIPADLDEVVATGLAKQPDERFATAGALAEAANAALRPAGAARPSGRQAERLNGARTKRVTLPMISSAEPTAVGPPRAEPSTNGSAADPASAGSAAPNSAAPGPAAPGPAAPGPEDTQVDTVAAPRRAQPAIPPEVQSTQPTPPGPQPSPAAQRAPATPPTPPPALGPQDRPEQAPGPHPVRRSEPSSAEGGTSQRTAIWAGSVLLLILAIGLVIVVVSNSGPVRTAPPATRGAPPAAAAAIRASLPVPKVVGSIATSATPGYAQVAPNGRFLYVANRNSQLITRVDTTTNAVTATIPIPASPPRFIAFAPDGKRAYVSIYNDQDTVNLVAVVDTATNTVLTNIPVDKRPFALALSPDQRTLWVPSHDSATIDVIDTSTNALVRRVPVARNPHWVAFGNGRAFVTDHESNLLTVLDPSSYAVLATIPMGASPHSVAVSPDGRRVSVVHFDSNNVYVVDTSTNQVVAIIPVGLNPQDVNYAPDGRHAYTANVLDGTVSVIDTATNMVTAKVPVGGEPTSVTVTPDGARAYVTCLDDSRLIILDTAGH